MSWSISLGRVGGTDIRIHLTFLLLLAWIGIAQYVAGGAAAALNGIALIIAIFACVVLHELGHAFAARRYGIATPDITLLPIGGLARLSRIPENPREEIAIALAGPAVNVVIAAVLIVVLGATVDPATLGQLDSPNASFLGQLAAVNIFLVLFNLIPAFPMDGGRVLRAVLALRLGRRRATEIAALIGQALAFFFGFVGLMGGNPILIFIAIFVYIAAGAEAGEAGLSELARSLPVEAAMVRTFESLRPMATLDEAANALIRTTQHEFPIVDGAGVLRGFLTRDDMIKALTTSGPQRSVLEVMTPVPTIRPGARLSTALNLMREERAPIVAVTDLSGRLYGYISHENLGELLMVRSGREKAQAAGTTGSTGKPGPVW
jgi:Zn-dependent protease/CBS domain-containing protein